jgi:hypothetical protein
MRPMRYALGAIAAILAALFIWANQWEYFQSQNHLLRVNRFTGTAYELQPTGDWARPTTLYEQYKATH